MPENSKVYLLDRDFSIVSYHIPQSLIAYQAAILNKDFANAQNHFAQLDESYHTKVAKFLEHQGFKDQALEISKDSDHKLELALVLGKLNFARDVILGMGGNLVGGETAIKGSIISGYLKKNRIF